MIRFGAILTLLGVLLGGLPAQERHASVLLEDGRRFEGRVLSLDLEHLVIQVGQKRLQIPASFVRSCRFHAVAPPPAEPAPAPAGEVAPSAESPPDPPSAPDAPSPAPSDGSGEGAVAEGPAAEAPAAEPAADADGAGSAGITWSGPLEDPVGGNEHNTELFDAGVRSLWQRRMAQLEARYPWLAPLRPTQWFSIGLLLLIGSGLIVHLSVVVAGAEMPELGRSVMLGIWYLATGLGQVAIVSVNDLSVVLMLLANTTMALFGLCSLFGLSRFGALVAMLVQLGFGALVFGVFELVTALLGTVGAAA